jgi:hypothetical protein
LTAERDILNNTLEQTKRDLNRELGKRGVSAAASKQGGRKWFTLVVAVCFFILGARMEAGGRTKMLKKLPVVGKLMPPHDEL